MKLKNREEKSIKWRKISINNFTIWLYWWLAGSTCMCMCVCVERITKILSPWNHFSVVFVSILCVVCRLIFIVFKSSFVLELFYPHPLYYAYLYNAAMMMVTLEWQYVNAGVVGVANKVIKAIFFIFFAEICRENKF